MEYKQISKTKKQLQKTIIVTSDLIKALNNVKKMNKSITYCMNCKHCELQKIFEKDKILQYYIYCKKCNKYIAAGTNDEILHIVKCKEN